jgi:hypothetical protein
MLMDSLKSRQLTSYVGKILNYWTSDVLNIPLYFGQRSHMRIDLLGDSIGIEVKGRNRKYSERWAVHHHQFENFPHQHPHHDLYYAFILYSMNRTADDIFTHDTRIISRYMTQREIWILPWSFVQPYAVSDCKTGKYVNVAKEEFSSQNTFWEYEYGSSRIMVPKGSSLVDHLESP